MVRADDDDDGERFPPGEDADEAAESWQFELDEVDEDGIVRSRSRIETGDPEPEHVLFVVLGALSMVLVFVRLWLLA